MPTLLGVGVEYISSAVAFFERLRQIEESAEHIVVLAGPVSFLLASDTFSETLEEVLAESIPEGTADHDRAQAIVRELIPILRQRKEGWYGRKPGILNLISGAEIDRFLRNVLVGRLGLPEGIVPGALPHNSFQIFRQADRKILTLSPFRLGEQPNVHGGIAMITSAPEALELHERMVEDMWRRAHKGQAAAAFMRGLIQKLPD